VYGVRRQLLDGRGFRSDVQELEKRPGAEEVEIVRIRVRGVAEAFAVCPRFGPLVIEPCECSFVVIDSALRSFADAVEARMGDDQSKKDGDGNCQVDEGKMLTEGHP
jgi:hypothetical protein